LPKHPEYLPKWEQADYPAGMGSAEVCLPPHSDFIRVYHLTSAEYALAAISLGRLKA